MATEIRAHQMAESSMVKAVKHRHAAALALVGWYLLAPPVHQPKHDPPYVDEHAAYRDWKILHTFKMIDECEAGQKRATLDAENGHLTAFSGGYEGVVDEDPKPWLTQQAEAECIAIDDPRLKQK
jgi:hypothetical protein